jgi:hypothetical protein
VYAGLGDTTPETMLYIFYTDVLHDAMLKQRCWELASTALALTAPAVNRQRYVMRACREKHRPSACVSVPEGRPRPLTPCV